jgi:hypothetical protein
MEGVTDPEGLTVNAEGALAAGVLIQKSSPIESIFSRI